jgi:hypothetical protein
MPGKKIKPSLNTNLKRGVFFFELLMGMFLLLICLSIVWNGFLYAIKNYKTGSDLYNTIMRTSIFLESNRNNEALKETANDYTVNSSAKKVFLESEGLVFTINEFTLLPLNGDEVKEVRFWEYHGKN